MRLSVQVIAEANGRREQGSSGGGGRFDYAYFTDEVLADYARRAVDLAILNLDARPAPAGTMTVVFAALASVRNHISSNVAVRAARPAAAAGR